MDNIQARLLDSKCSNKLKDRVLWVDGDSSFDADNLVKLSQKYNVKYVTHINDVVAQYNQFTSKKDQFEIKQIVKPLTFDWIIPEEYKKLDVVDYVFKTHELLFKDIDEQEKTTREKRLLTELLLYKKRGLIDVLRTVIYVINTLWSHKIVWGVGRGSSVSSYVLFVVGVHDVDSYTYELPFDDFLT